jgi:hypothetical protein
MTSEDREYQQSIRREIDARLSAFSLAYAKCKCNTCRITVINQMEDAVNAELFYWNDTLQAPLKAGENIEMDAFDNSLNHIVALNELVDRFNELRKELLNS